MSKPSWKFIENANICRLLIKKQCVKNGYKGTYNIRIHDKKFSGVNIFVETTKENKKLIKLHNKDYDYLVKLNPIVDQISINKIKNLIDKG